MLFRKKVSRSCRLCRYSSGLDDMHLLCRKLGVVGVDHKCFRFRYEPLRRVPAPRLKVRGGLDFKIED